MISNCVDDNGFDIISKNLFKCPNLMELWVYYNLDSDKFATIAKMKTHSPSKDLHVG